MRHETPIDKAVAYFIPRWDNLLNHLPDKFLDTDNNLAENAIRPITPAERITYLTVLTEEQKELSYFTLSWNMQKK